MDFVSEKSNEDQQNDFLLEVANDYQSQHSDGVYQTVSNNTSSRQKLMSELSSSRVLFSDGFDFWKFVGVENEKLRTHSIKSKVKTKSQLKSLKDRNKENALS